MNAAEKREQRDELKRKEWLERTTPKCCPKCGESSGLVTHLVTWFAHSLDEQDLHNTGELVEHQCGACAISFWM